MGGKTRLRGELKGGKPEQTLGRNEHLPHGHHAEGAAGLGATEPVTQLCDPKRRLSVAPPPGVTIQDRGDTHNPSQSRKSRCAL